VSGRPFEPAADLPIDMQFGFSLVALLRSERLTEFLGIERFDAARGG
jgi:hypothetical protein